MSEVTEMTSTLPLTDDMYFAPLLPWQSELWSVSYTHLRAHET